MLDEENPIVDDVPVIDEPVSEESVNEEPINLDTAIITVEDLKKRLRLAGIDYSSYTDEDLEAYINLIIERIEAETGLPIVNPRLITEYDDLFDGKVYETDYYPLTCCRILLDGEVIDAHKIDCRRGIIYFRPGVAGDLTVKYNIQYRNGSVLSNLISNMIILEIENDTVHGTWNSIREGEVSVTYGVGSGGLQERVDKAIGELKGYYRPRARLL